jgi:NAD(P)-dependent dehydrogenase (short-subunit alcohol dehydrogenase family)
VEVNFYGVVNLSKAAVPVLREQGGGHIIQVSSVGGRVATPGMSAYQSAKWAVNGFSEVLAREVAPLGIRVTVLEPGGMRTDWAGSSMTIAPVSQPYRQTVGAIARMLRAGEGTRTNDPRRVAQVILRLVAEEHPPVRLLLGSDAARYAAEAAKAQAESDAAWRHLTACTDYPDLTDKDTDPLGHL